MLTPYNWEWKCGKVRLHLGYEQGDKFYDHDFLFEAEKTK